MHLAAHEWDESYLGEFLTFSFSIEKAESCKVKSAVVCSLLVLPFFLTNRNKILLRPTMCPDKRTYFLVSFVIISGQWKVSWGFLKSCSSPLSSSSAWNMNVINEVAAAISLSWGNLGNGMHKLKRDEQKDRRNLGCWWPWSCHLAKGFSASRLYVTCHKNKSLIIDYNC